MKKIYFLLTLAGIITLSGCIQTAQAPNEEQGTINKESGDETAAEDAKENGTDEGVNQAPNTGDTPAEAEEFVEYTNDEFDFKVDHPKSWEVKEETAEDGAKKITIRNTETDATGFIIFPHGGFLSDEPGGEKKEAALTLGDKPAKQTEYDNGLIIVRPQEFPASWNGDGRIELSTTDPNNFYEMITSFEFTE